MHIALSITWLRVISPNPRKSFFQHQCSAPARHTWHWHWREGRTHLQQCTLGESLQYKWQWLALLGHVLLLCCSKGIVMWLVGTVLSRVPCSCGHLGEAFQLLSVTARWWDSVHSWTGTSLQAEGLLASPAVAPMYCHVLIGTAENLVLHLRNALLSLWISNYGKKRLLKSCFENVFQILSFSSNKHCQGTIRETFQYCAQHVEKGTSQQNIFLCKSRETAL